MEKSNSTLELRSVVRLSLCCLPRWVSALTKSCSAWRALLYGLTARLEVIVPRYYGLFHTLRVVFAADARWAVKQGSRRRRRFFITLIYQIDIKVRW
jgi:hypothetical protein